MAKGTKLSEFQKSEITAMKRVGKSQREISKALGRSKTLICNYLKSPNKYGTRKPTGRPETIITIVQKKNFPRCKGENIVNIKNIEIFGGCSLQY